MTHDCLSSVALALLVVLWLLIGTRSRLLVVGLLLQYCRTFVPLSVSLWNDLSDPVFDGVGLAGFKSRANSFLLALSALSFLSPTIFTLGLRFLD